MTLFNAQPHCYHAAHSVTREYPDEVDKILEDIAKSGIVRQVHKYTHLISTPKDAPLYISNI